MYLFIYLFIVNTNCSMTNDKYTITKLKKYFRNLKECGLEASCGFEIMFF